MDKSPTIGELAKALALAQGQMRGAVKDANNPFFKSKYADLASVWDACRDALSKNGLAVAQPCRANGAQVTVTTMLIHTSGEWLADDLTVTAKEDAPQAIGSALTYCRRYGLSSMVGIAPEDDDGEAAHARQAPLQAQPSEKERAAILARAARVKGIFDRAKTLIGDANAIKVWIHKISGAKGSQEWTAEDMDKMEIVLGELADAARGK